ncbi:Gfo/Idh/MocA family oxidoreductase [Streptomyces sp. SID8361]|uniref:Gfo/Idh/MocA family protein n=1 Tax=Streptomyces sp. MnatMP-M27 TaxID=1839768 RepID=UPI00081E82F9|nr:Gfo/Idh/MocA family oxidoreductase [Streptomyces sp. MnatMP-M27]MYU14715.1 Gfo/Idh/MocA family oxidoreductase [Streptomyces sp. SID8361]SCG07067.1 Oxidoreductase family, NAD-binding Rossmann fold [Streptomyces sp. MnatMP-M27]
MTVGSTPSRAVVVGTGSRAQMFTEALARRPHLRVAALCDPNPVRIAHHQRLLKEAGEPEAATWSPAEFERRLRADDIQEVVVTCVDALHDGYIVPALRAGCRVVTEKPMTTDAAKCRRILETVGETGNHLTVAFNYRFNPVHEEVHRQLSGGAIGEVLSVHFEWLLDTRHGADYFRRWHREKQHSGGLMVHKSSHHFDLVNWWLGARPEEVFGYGGLGFYGRAAGERSGYRREYERAHGATAARDDPFALELAGNDALRSLYLDAEGVDGYHRDRNVFGDGITIEDDMALLVRYDTGATMTYHLTAYSPWEGYRVMFNGTRGRLELEVEESRWQPPVLGTSSGRGAVHGDQALANAGGPRLVLRPLWEPPREVALPEFDHAGHGGGDERMLDVLYGPVDPAATGKTAVDGADVPDTRETPDTSDASDASDTSDASRRSATEEDGALALVTGLAANRSFADGKPVTTADVVTL